MTGLLLVALAASAVTPLTAAQAEVMATELSEAEKACIAPVTGSTVPYFVCLGDVDRPIWAKRMSEALPAFEAFRRRRLQIVKDAESHRITPDAFIDALKVAARDFRQVVHPDRIEPDWLKKPTEDQLAELYPKAAIKLNVQALVTLTCRIDATGQATKCFVEKETPTGYGFGDAALKATVLMSFSPAKENGVSVGDTEVQIPLVFKLPKTWLQRMADTLAKQP